MTVKDLAEELNIRVPSVSETVCKLMARGLVEKVASSEDRRSAKLYLTEEGEEAAKRHKSERELYVKDYFKALSEDEKEQLAFLLKKILTSDPVDEEIK